MNRRLLTILVAALVVSTLVTFVVYNMVNSRISAVKTVASTNVVAAKLDIKLGNLLSADNLTTVSIAGAVPKGSILAKDLSKAVGRGVISDLYEGEPINESRLAAPGSGGGLAATIPLGMRACAVRVDDVVNVSGFVTPGMRVDVLVSGNPPGAQSATQGQVTKTLLQNIQVLSAGTGGCREAGAGQQFLHPSGSAQSAGHQGRSRHRHRHGQLVYRAGGHAAQTAKTYCRSQGEGSAGLFHRSAQRFKIERRKI